MDDFWTALMLLMAWLPAGVATRVVGLVAGFGVVTGLKNTRLRRPSIAVGEAVNLCSLVLAVLRPILAALGRLIVGIYWIASLTRGAAGSALVVGSIATAVIAPIYLYAMVFSVDQTPRDVA